MRYIPFLILVYIWLVAGRTDPNDLLQSMPLIRWLTYILVPMCLLVGLFHVVGQCRLRRTIIDGPFVLLLLLMGLSTYLNDTSWNDLFYGIGVYLRYPILFILFCNFPNITSVGRKFTKALVVLVALLIAEAIANYLVFGRKADDTFFTLGVTWGTSNAGIFFAAIVSLIAAHAQLKRPRYYHIIGLILIMIAAAIASIRTTLIFSGGIYLIIFYIQKKYLTSRGLIAIVISITSAIFIATLINWHAVLSPSPFLSKFDPGYRLEFIREVMIHILDSGDLLLGAGLRSMNPGAAQSPGVLYKYFLENAKWIVSLGSNQYVKGLAELGIVGMLVYWYMLYRVLRVAWLNWILIRDNYYAPLWLKVVNLAFFGIWSFYACFGLISNDLWRMDASSIIFWFYAAIIATYYRKNRKAIVVMSPVQSSLYELANAR